MATSTQKERVFRCAMCGNRTAQQILSEHSPERWVSYGEDDYEAHWEPAGYSYISVVCSTCGEFGLYSDVYIVDESEPRCQFPRTQWLGKEVPEIIQAIYDEAWTVKEASPKSFAVQIGRALEALCADKNAVGSTLDQQLTYLVAQLAIPADIASLTRALRLLRNMRAHHKLGSVTKEQTDIIDGFFKAFLEYVYIAPVKMSTYQMQLQNLKL